MKVYDCITFFNELDLLEIRLESLDSVVDYFVINEATVTFQGNPKPLYYGDNKERFKKFEHKIIHNIVDDTPETNNNWDNDEYHKNCTMRALKNCGDDDIIIYSDADEICNPNVLSFVLKNLYEPNKLFVFVDQKYMCYFMNAEIKGVPWIGTRFSNWGLLKKYSIDLFRNFQKDFWKNHSDEIVKITESDCGMITGWHYTFLGGLDQCIYKIESWGHKEFNIPSVKNSFNNKISNLKDFASRPGFDAQLITLDETNCLEYVFNNLDKFKHLILKKEN